MYYDVYEEVSEESKKFTSGHEIRTRNPSFAVLRRTSGKCFPDFRIKKTKSSLSINDTIVKPECLLISENEIPGLSGTFPRVL